METGVSSGATRVPDAPAAATDASESLYGVLNVLLAQRGLQCDSFGVRWCGSSFLKSTGSCLGQTGDVFSWVRCRAREVAEEPKRFVSLPAGLGEMSHEVSRDPLIVGRNILLSYPVQREDLLRWRQYPADGCQQIPVVQANGIVPDQPALGAIIDISPRNPDLVGILDRCRHEIVGGAVGEASHDQRVGEGGIGVAAQRHI